MIRLCLVAEVLPIKAWLLGVLVCAASLGVTGPLSAVAEAAVSQSTVDTTGKLVEVRCPWVSQCTALDDRGREVTFNPQSPGHPVPLTILPGSSVISFDCPSADQCTAVGRRPERAGMVVPLGGAKEVTFNPTSISTPTPVAIDNPASYVVPCDVLSLPHTPSSKCFIERGGGLTALACPSVSQCTAVDELGAEVTFGPASPLSYTVFLFDVWKGEPFKYPIDSVSFEFISCPSVTQCTAGETGGPRQRLITFNPTAPAVYTVRKLTGFFESQGFACPSVSVCVITDEPGQAFVFDPSLPGSPFSPVPLSRAFLPVSKHGILVGRVVCPAVSQCTALVRGYFTQRLYAATFNPGAPNKITRVRIHQSVGGVVCPSVSQCTGISGHDEITFDPRSAGSAAVRCVVPKLKGTTLKKAKRLLRGAHCGLGRITKRPSHKRALVVVSQKPAAKASLPSGAKVSVRLG